MNRELDESAEAKANETLAALAGLPASVVIPELIAKLDALLAWPTFLAWPAGVKGSPRKWKNLTRADIALPGDLTQLRPDYVAELCAGNVGVALGVASNGLWVLDVDDDSLVEPILALNPVLEGTLRTRGSRGCSFWIRSLEPSVKSRKFQGGEIRGNGCQSIIAGLHPKGNLYSILKMASPVTLSVTDLRLPSLPQNTTETDSVVSVASVPSVSSVSSVSSVPSVASGGSYRILTVDEINEVVAGTVPTGPHQNHKAVFGLARKVKGLELLRGSKLSPSDLKDIFQTWANQAQPYFRPGATVDGYEDEFMRAYTGVKKPSVPNLPLELYAKIGSLPVPAAVSLVQDPKLKELTILCAALAEKSKPEPFFIACRTVQAAFKLANHKDAAQWLKVLVGRCILEIVDAGSPSTMRATRYRFVGPQ